MQKSKVVRFVAALVLISVQMSAVAQVYKDSKASFENRVKDLLQKMTLKEKISLLGYNSPSIERLGVPAYNWWNEALHGVARNGEATVFPQAIGMAATFDNDLVKSVASVISTEARAKYNLAIQQNRRGQYMGLTFWTPNINIFRDPRWGRGQETYGEDPFLTSAMGTSFVNGLQGNDPHYLKTAACAKHYAVHSGPEAERDSFNAVIGEKDLRETYLYAFKKLVDAKVEAVMCAYNRVNNQPCCTGPGLLHDILHTEWNFQGHVVTDCGALDDVLSHHKTYPTRVEVAAAAIKAGVDLECGSILQRDVQAAIDTGLLSVKDVDNALTKTLQTEFRLGFFDEPSKVPFSKYGADSVHNDGHVALTRRIAAQSMVLLKNNGVLPLQSQKYASILVTGSNSSSLDALMGNYHGVTNNMVTFAEGITKAAGLATSVQYDQGCDFTDTAHFGGIWASQNSDLTIAVVGLTPLLEGEAGDAFLSLSTGDRQTLSLPRSQIVFLKKLRAAHKKPVVVVVTGGSAVNIKEIEPFADAIVMAWYPGEQGGNALADVLYGKVSPSGRLPVTFYNSLDDLPDYHNYNMAGRTYRYFKGDVQYPFGFGLSYTSFSCKWLKQPEETFTKEKTIECTVDVANTGNYDGDEVIQLYIEYPDIKAMPVKELKAFKKVHVKKGETAKATLSISASDLQKWDEATQSWKLYPGKYNIVIAKNANEKILEKSITIN